MEVGIGRLHLLISELDRRTGGSDVSSAVLARCDLSPDTIAAPDFTFDAHQEAQLVRHACDAVDDITFGVRSGLRFASASSLTAYISKYSRDLKQVAENASRFHQLIDPTLVFNLRLAGNFATFEGDWKDAGYARYHRRTEFLLFAALARMRNLAQVDFYPIELRFQHEVGARASEFERQAGFPVVFGAERLEIVLSLSTLDLPVPTYDPRLRQHLLDHAETVLARHRSPRQKLRAKVEGLITRSLPGRIIQAEDAAGILGLSPRSFARKLRGEDTSYREIVEDLRCDLAQTFLLDGMSLSEVAYCLGYSDQAAFSTAFKRWTGQAPGAFRNRVDRPFRI